MGGAFPAGARREGVCVCVEEDEVKCLFGERTMKDDRTIKHNTQD